MLLNTLAVDGGVGSEPLDGAGAASVLVPTLRFTVRSAIRSAAIPCTNHELVRSRAGVNAAAHASGGPGAKHGDTVQKALHPVMGYPLDAEACRVNGAPTDEPAVGDPRLTVTEARQVEARNGMRTKRNFFNTNSR